MAGFLITAAVVVGLLAWIPCALACRVHAAGPFRMTPANRSLRAFPQQRPDRAPHGSLRAEGTAADRWITLCVRPVRRRLSTGSVPPERAMAQPDTLLRTARGHGQQSRPVRGRIGAQVGPGDLAATGLAGRGCARLRRLPASLAAVGPVLPFVASPVVWRGIRAARAAGHAR